MNFIAFTYATVQSATPNLHVLAATMWYGDRIGGGGDVMELFYGSSGKYPEYCGAIDFRFDWDHYYIEQMSNNTGLLAAFAGWIHRFGENAIIVATEGDHILLQKMVEDNLLILPDSCIVVNLDTVKALSDVESYAQRFGIKPCKAMKAEGGEPVRIASMKALCYRNMMAALSLHEQPTTLLVPILGNSTLLGLPV